MAAGVLLKKLKLKLKLFGDLMKLSDFEKMVFCKVYEGRPTAIGTIWTVKTVLEFHEDCDVEYFSSQSSFLDFTKLGKIIFNGQKRFVLLKYPDFITERQALVRDYEWLHVNTSIYTPDEFCDKFEEFHFCGSEWHKHPNCQKLNAVIYGKPIEVIAKLKKEL